MKHTKPLFALLAVLTLTVTVACQKEENNPVQPQTDMHLLSFVGTVWEGQMVNPTFEETYWDETMVFLSDTSVLMFRRAIFEGELTGARTINTTYHFDGISSGTIFKDEAIPFHYDTIDNTPTITIEDYYPHVFHEVK